MRRYPRQAPSPLQAKLAELSGYHGSKLKPWHGCWCGCRRVHQADASCLKESALSFISTVCHLIDIWSDWLRVRIGVAQIGYSVRHRVRVRVESYYVYCCCSSIRLCVNHFLGLVVGSPRSSDRYRMHTGGTCNLWESFHTRTLDWHSSTGYIRNGESWPRPGFLIGRVCCTRQ